MGRLRTLTDIFARRYESVTLWNEFRETDRRFLVQAFQIIDKDLLPFNLPTGKEDPTVRPMWQAVHDKLCRELGMTALAQAWYTYETTVYGQKTTQSGYWPLNTVCQQFLCAQFNGSEDDADLFLKHRLSFVELAFREFDNAISTLNANLEQAIRLAKLGNKRSSLRGIDRPDPEKDMRAHNTALNQRYAQIAEELNVRMRQAGYQLNYHSGFIQRSSDQLVADRIEKPFWALVAATKWANVNVDMKEALDRRDSGGRDAAFYAARALESTIKIISDENGWTHGGEKGAHNYIDNLGSTRAGHFISAWESTILKTFFTDVRNPLGHGPGSQSMPALTNRQTDWAIETCMSWVKSLIERQTQP